MVNEQPFYVQQALDEIKKKEDAEKRGKEQRRAQLEQDQQMMNEALAHTRRVVVDRLVGECNAQKLPLKNEDIEKAVLLPGIPVPGISRGQVELFVEMRFSECTPIYFGPFLLHKEASPTGWFQLVQNQGPYHVFAEGIQPTSGNPFPSLREALVQGAIWFQEHARRQAFNPHAGR